MTLEDKNKFEQFINNAKTNIAESQEVIENSSRYIVHLPKALERERIGEDFSNGKEIELRIPRETFNNENKL